MHSVRNTIGFQSIGAGSTAIPKAKSKSPPALPEVVSMKGGRYRLGNETGTNNSGMEISQMEMKRELLVFSVSG